MKNLPLIVYILLGLLNMYASATGNAVLVYISKPALMLVLLAYFMRRTPPPHNVGRRLMVAALVFSWLGDTLLMFVENPPHIEWFFLLGLVAFLCTHLFYIAYFYKLPAKGEPFLRRQPLWVIPFIAFLIGNTTLLWPGIPVEMKAPVAVYSSVIVAMAFSCLNLKGRIPKGIFGLLLGGVLLFVVSDTLIGLNKFRFPNSYTQSFIMLFYLAGQWLIAEGAIRMERLSPNGD